MQNNTIEPMSKDAFDNVNVKVALIAAGIVGLCFLCNIGRCLYNRMNRRAGFVAIVDVEGSINNR